jgi:hypothetical protein
MHRGSAHLRRDFRERPAASVIACEDELRAIDEPPLARSSIDGMRGSWPQRAAHQREDESLGFQRLGGAASQPMAQQRHQRLRSRIDAQPLRLESGGRSILEQRSRSELAQLLFPEGEREVRVAARNRMAHAVRLAGVEEQHLVRLRNGLVAAHMAHVHAAIGKHEMRPGCAFLAAFGAGAIHGNTRRGS